MDRIANSPEIEEDETYRLFGVSAFRTKQDDLICLRFDTCYCGRYYDMFYVFIDIREAFGNQPTVIAHTLPNFLPMEMWEKKYLCMDVQSFSQCVSLHLNSYIARREQLREVDQVYSESLEVTSSDSFCHVNIDFDDCIIKLLYKPDQRYPYSVERVISSSGDRMLQKQLKQAGFDEKALLLFKSMSNLSALQTALSNE